KIVALVAQHDLTIPDLAVKFPLLLQRVLYFKEVGEIGIHIKTQFHFLGLGTMIEYGQVLYESVTDKAAPYDRDGRILVNGPGWWNTKMLAIVILNRIGRENIQGRTFNGQLPLREVAHIFVKKPLWLVGTGIDISVG